MIAHDYAVKTGSLNQNDLLDVTDYHSIDYRNGCYQALVGHSRSVRAPHRADAHISWPERSRSHLKAGKSIPSTTTRSSDDYGISDANGTGKLG